MAAALTAAEPVVTPMPELALPAPASAVSPVVTPVPPVPVPVPPTDPATAAPTQTAAAAPVEAAPKTPVAAPREAPEAPEAPKARVIAPVAPDPLPAPVHALVEPVEQAVEQAVEQVQPVNINISVRVDSPGDNGAVTQINEAVSAPLPGDAPAETRYQEPDQQYQDAGTAGETSVAPTPPDNPVPAAETTAAPADSWNWTWTWSCGDVMPPEIVLPEEYLQQIWNWNWTWNCGGNTSTNGNSETQLPPQYQPVTSQYQPINVNVSIRIASPGNDGPVVQTNVALAMTTVVQVVQVAAIHLPPLPLPALPAPAVSVGGPSVSTVEVAAAILGQPQVSSDAESAPRVEQPSSEAAGDSPTALHSILQPAPERAPRDTGGSIAGDTPALVSAEAIAALAPPAPAVEAGRRARVQEQRPRTQARPIVSDGLAASPVSYASVGPLGATGSDRTPLLIFVILTPFLLAFADAARRVAEEWKAEAADSGRRREKPG